MASKDNVYPWLQLLDLEGESRRPPERRRRRGAGRPKNMFPRKKASLTLTDEEREMVDELITFLSERFDHALSRGQLYGFLAFRLKAELERDGKLELPKRVESFTELAHYLDQKASKAA